MPIAGRCQTPQKVSLLDWQGVTNRIGVENDGAIIADDTGLKMGNGLVGPNLADHHLARLSPGRIGAFKRQFTWRNTVPSPGGSSATTALRIALVIPHWTTLRPYQVPLNKQTKSNAKHLVSAAQLKKFACYA